MRIALRIERTLDLEALNARRHIFLSRLTVRLQFRQSRSSGWSDYHTAIVDTGAPYSLIPRSLWAAAHVERLTAMPVRGIVPGQAAELPAELARVSGRVLDARRTSPRLSLWAMLAHTDAVPLILGWAGCLDRARLILNAPRQQAWLDF